MICPRDGLFGEINRGFGFLRFGGPDVGVELQKGRKYQNMDGIGGRSRRKLIKERKTCKKR